MSDKAHSRPYGAIFLALFVLTVFEVFVAQMHLFSKTGVVFLLIFLALVKAALVGLFYMHLRFEKIFLTVVILSPLIFSFIFTLMISWDVSFSHHP